MLAPEAIALALGVEALTGAIVYLTGITSQNGYVRTYRYKDYSVNEERVETYIFSSYTDAQNEVGARFIGGCNNEAKPLYSGVGAGL
ncbi:hypothetical protein [Tepidibacter thalassicus]|uniref:Uncharacterized protein n=1 Tax=Tepidibacter thalassicus DSM 15285 TaxID=1123350 RepID=A0A1M5TZB5_9FIRM|nr:hypothetical protein [Tepidibacter thalassicus]SHH56028.1 hypothetical protein SAMN02744040_02343 [Tepidibacter thalassicus DSM 15285]